MDSKIDRHLCKDKTLKPIVQGHNLSVLEVSSDTFNKLTETIISQQLSVKAAATIVQRFYDLFSKPKLEPLDVLRITHDEMRGAGLSNQKARYVKNVATFFEENVIFDDMWNHLSDQDIVDKLTSIKGIGIWTVHMLLIFHLGRPDVLPIGDLIIRNKMIELYDLKSTGKNLIKDLRDIGVVWKPYSSYAARYLWAYNNS